MNENKTISKTVRVWLIIGLVMIFFQIIIGGVTRLTGSGLSITKWEIVTGTFPPMSAAGWESEFELYKDTPQYKKINEGMSMSDFKFIYFWEYFHRLWARTMGFVFLIPFIFFWFTNHFTPRLTRRLIVVFLLAALVAVFGWIMVASGLVNRPWVNAYKLTVHLCLAVLLFGYLLWTTFIAFEPIPRVQTNKMLITLGKVFTTLTVFQIFLGGIMSGMKAGLFYPTWPDMNGMFIPPEVFDISQYNVENVVEYDKHAFMPAMIQTLHRLTAYSLVIIGLWMFSKSYKQSYPQVFRINNIMLITMLGIQVLLGIFTLINCKGSIPVGLGSMHQGGGILLLSVALFNNYLMRKN